MMHGTMNVKKNVFCIFITEAPQNGIVEKTCRKYDGSERSLIGDGELCGICAVVKFSC